MTGLDTNILIRYVTQDDARLTPRANAIMSAVTVEEPGWIALTALTEFVWVLSRRFRIDRRGIHVIVQELLSQPKLILEQHELVRKAAGLYLQGNADFSDYLVACAGQAAGCTQTLTFDRKAAKSAGMTLVS
jgi:predicted nucleic-acid-binding protein